MLTAGRRPDNGQIALFISTTHKPATALWILVRKKGLLEIFIQFVATFRPNLVWAIKADRINS
ncbi:hypothetical protein TcasGA2_TC000510 [Tribolium castaneum]|uniref:Uncharacterized protein n=1 Tax=Tribolium castaneum TaxID=7070 RepID=D6W9X0_TRICA|nr:hypothetical protein TcasGA2_TC000510 [Tribolium castaneum]